jgi:hypothetical protein
MLGEPATFQVFFSRNRRLKRYAALFADRSCPIKADSASREANLTSAQIIVAAPEGWPSFDLASLGESVLTFGIAVELVIWLREIRSHERTEKPAEDEFGGP